MGLNAAIELKNISKSFGSIIANKDVCLTVNRGEILSILGENGSGKTTLLKKLIPALCARGIRPGLIKHTHHDMDVDKPGKDSYELRKAGAAQTIVASQQRWALMTETPDEEELDLHFLASRMDTSKLDLILVEGFDREAHLPTLEVWRTQDAPFRSCEEWRRRPAKRSCLYSAHRTSTPLPIS